MKNSVIGMGKRGSQTDSKGQGRDIREEPPFVDKALSEWMKGYL